MIETWQIFGANMRNTSSFWHPGSRFRSFWGLEDLELKNYHEYLKYVQLTKIMGTQKKISISLVHTLFSENPRWRT